MRRYPMSTCAKASLALALLVSFRLGMLLQDRGFETPPSQSRRVGSSSQAGVNTSPAQAKALDVLKARVDGEQQQQCEELPLLRRISTSEGLDFGELDEFIDLTEPLLGGPSPGVVYNFRNFQLTLDVILASPYAAIVLDPNRPETFPSGLSVIMLLTEARCLFWQAYPTVPVSERVALASSNSTKLCLLSNWLHECNEQTNGEVPCNLDTQFFTSISSGSWLTPQGYYFSAGKKTGELLYERARGFPSQRRYPLRSQSKALVAATVLALQDRGFLSVDDPVAQLLSAFDVPGLRNVTIRHLLTHTSGKFFLLILRRA
jgi:hypothetical protein